MVRFSPQDPKGPVDLFKQDEGSQLMGEGEPGERQGGPGSPAHALGQTQSSADHKCQPCPRFDPPGIQLAGECLRCEAFAPAVQGYEQRFAASCRQQAVSFLLLDLFDRSRDEACREWFGSDRTDLAGSVRCEAAKVVAGALQVE